MSMTKLNQNTTDLQALAASTGYQEVLDMVNALPDGGSGAAVETCTVTVPTSGEYRVGATCYKDGAFEAVLFLPVEDGAEIENVVKGTSLCIFDVNSATAPSIENANYIATSPYYGDIHPLSLHVYQVATQ